MNATELPEKVTSSVTHESTQSYFIPFDYTLAAIIITFCAYILVCYLLSRIKAEAGRSFHKAWFPLATFGLAVHLLGWIIGIVKFSYIFNPDGNQMNRAFLDPIYSQFTFVVYVSTFFFLLGIVFCISMFIYYSYDDW